MATLSPLEMTLVDSSSVEVHFLRYLGSVDFKLKGSNDPDPALHPVWSAKVPRDSRVLVWPTTAS
ncbi:uncharacterized protein N7515_005275 [Penicillium bovifimosum]|uniref:Uncharacterized protein n=1 Tax=Penicillium bovifimosum TaxID=126998 RepID=A0A9W9GTQ0_9EURO|nr:uncharacterized protein N7515_005275 [Penicillium bovifimosum]KAJ5129236.1 hypothetical protein N7515_005275 [Penicillium bovifimosum]